MLLKGVLFGVGVFLLLSFGALLLAPSLLHDRVVELVERQINERLEATVSFEEIEISLLSTFPALTIEVVGLDVVGAGTFEGVTLASMRTFRVEADLVRLVRDDQLLIESVTIDQPRIDLRVNEDGEANYDIVKAADEEEVETGEEGEPLALHLRRYQVRGGQIEYDGPDAEISLEGLEHQGSAAIDGATSTVSSSTTVDALTVQVAGVRYIRKASASVDLGAVLRADEERLDVERLQVALNELSGEASGAIEWADGTVDLDLEVESGKGQSIRALVSAIPAAYAGDLDGLQATGTYALSAKVKGRVSSREGYAPSFAASLRVSDGTLQHRDLALPLHGIEIAAKLSHPGGHLDKTKIDIGRLSARAGKGHVEGQISISKPLSNPFVEVAMEGQIDLAELSQAYPLPDGVELRGDIGFDLDLATKGDHVRRLSGWMNATAVAYRPEDAPHIGISRASIRFTPRATKVGPLHGAYGKSDLAIRGSLSSLSVLFRDDERFLGELQLESRSLFLDEILEGESVDIPENLDITIAAKAKKLMRKKLVLLDMRGVVLIKDGDWSLTDVRSDAGSQHAEALLSSLKGESILAPIRSRPRLIPPLKLK